jgi:hypothetical protein
MLDIGQRLVRTVLLDDKPPLPRRCQDLPFLLAKLARSAIGLEAPQRDNQPLEGDLNVLR